MEIGHKRGWVAMILALGLIAGAAASARADIDTGFKVELFEQAQEIKARALEFQKAVHRDLAANLFKAQYWVKRAYLETRAAEDPLTPAQAAEITAKIQSAEYYKDLALSSIQTGGVVLEAKLELKEIIIETINLIEQAQTAPQRITPKEADELQSGYLEPMLADLAYKDQLLIYIDYLLEEVNKRLSDARAAATEHDRRETKSNLRRAKSKLRWALSRVWQIKWNMMYLIHRVYGFIIAVSRAPVLGLGLAGPTPEGPPHLEGVRLLQGPEAIEFIPQGRGIVALRVQVFDLGGREVFDSGFTWGSALRWPLTHAHHQGKPPANGVYLYLITARGADGRLMRGKLGKLVVLR